ncbi:hypothetical protein CSO01_09900 [Cellulomonas soli]|uniref:Uncharacterized protein n=1 Tax=Cellulomonas soli TaxID=931535 RepID=A0A512PAQ3_9CELL|nr:hypothetical protein CSO01_09900 [Cellulomonas soli]
MRFLVVDEGHGDAVIGLIGLGDPVFGLGARDEWIGWTRAQRGRRLTSVMDAFVLGALPPYSGLLGGKLVALLAGSREIQEIFEQRYGHRTTLIEERDPAAKLAVVTTTSALGRSSIYNRLQRPDRSLAMRPVGYTGGSGDFHLGGELYELLAEYARSVDATRVTGHRHERWGRPGFRNRREVVQVALDALGLDSRALRMHGVKREIFVYETAQNSAAFLRGEDNSLAPYPTSSVSDLAEWWKGRWALPRSQAQREWQAFRTESWRLWSTAP